MREEVRRPFGPFELAEFFDDLVGLFERVDREVDIDGRRAVELAVDVESVGIGELPLVAVGGACEQQHAHVRGDRDAVALGLARGPAALHRRRRLDAEQFLDGVADERPVGRDLALGRPSAVIELGLDGALYRLHELVRGAIDAMPPCPNGAELRSLMLSEAKRLVPAKLAQFAA